MASTALLAQSDLPDGFRLVHPRSNVPPEGQDPEVCRGLKEVSDRFGPAQSTWAIDYGYETKFDQVIVSQIVSVWPEPIASQRRELSIGIAERCWRERIEVNLRSSAPETGGEVVTVVAERLDLTDKDAPLALGVRIAATVREAGLVFPVYFDFLYLANDRIAGRLEVRRPVEPPDSAVELALAREMNARMQRAQ